VIFPTTFELTLALGILSMLLLGSWASTLKMAGPKWRFELYYFDFAFGALVAALLVAFTFGSMGDELTFSDNVLIAGKRQLAFALAAGVVFNLANMLLLAGVSIVGMAVAFPISLGVALINDPVSKQLISKTGNPTFVYGSAGLVLASIVVAALAAAAAANRSVATAPPATGARNANVKSASSGGAIKGVIVCLVSGILMAGSNPLVSMARDGGSELGVGAYALMVFFAVGILVSTMIFSLYFINLPVHGNALELGDYLKGSLGQHLLGILGGLLWSVGMIAGFLTVGGTAATLVSPAISYALSHGGAVVSILWGLLIWRDFKGASGKATVFGLLTLLFLTGALAMMALAPGAAPAAAPAP
jgi:glucose uptake protein